MAKLPERAIRDRQDLDRFEAEMPLDERLPERSVLDVFTGAAARQPDRIALTMLMTGAPDEQPRRVTYAGLLELIRRAANLFTTLGGSRPGVAYMLPNLIETHATLWGAETAGYAVPINFLLQPDAIAALLVASGARTLVALGPHPVLDVWQKAIALRERVPGLTLVRVAPPGTPPEPGVRDFHAELMAQPGDRLTFAAPGRDDDVAAYFHTGGTTGTPKLVAQTHRGQLVAAMGGAVMAGMRATDAMPASLPLFHAGGTIFCGLSAFIAGMELLMLSPSGLRNPAMVQSYWRLCERYGATLLGAVPTSIGAVLETPVNGADLSTARAGFSGAAPLSPAVRERFTQITGRGLYEVYGMTESSGVISMDPVAGAGRAGSVGWAIPFTRVSVRRLAEDGRPGTECAPHEIGVIVVTGPHVSPGYRDSEHGKGVLAGSTLDTGDLGYTDEDGRLYVAGRAKDLIIRSGHNIDPLMIENAMMEHPAVALAAAVGMPDRYAGELPVCYVALKVGAQTSEAELQDHAQKAIAERPAWPKQIHIVAAIPITSVGKIYKPKLRCDAAARVVMRVVQGDLALAGAQVAVTEGGRRGMRVCVTLPPAVRAAQAEVEQALAQFLFEGAVEIDE